MRLPQQLSITAMQNQWATMIEPVINNPLNLANILKDVSLVTGNNVINHKLGRKMQGWFIVDIQGVSSIYRSAEFNELTLTLNSSASVTVSLGVF